MSVSFNGFNEKLVTFKTATALDAGTLVKLSANDTVAACSENDAFIGVVVSCRNLRAAVKLFGFTEVEYNGTAPSLGYNSLCAYNATKVEVDATNGRKILVISVNTSASTANILL